MTALGKAWDTAVRFVQEPSSNKITGKTVFPVAFGLACAAIYTVATGDNLSTVAPAAIGDVVGLALIKTTCGIYELRQ